MLVISQTRPLLWDADNIHNRNNLRYVAKVLKYLVHFYYFCCGIFRIASAYLLLLVRHGRDRGRIFLQMEGRCPAGVSWKRTSVVSSMELICCVINPLPDDASCYGNYMYAHWPFSTKLPIAQLIESNSAKVVVRICSVQKLPVIFLFVCLIIQVG